MARRIKLEYPQYKALEAALKAPVELTEWTRDRMAYRKSIFLHLSDTAIEFVGPWKHEYHETEGGCIPPPPNSPDVLGDGLND